MHMIHCVHLHEHNRIRIRTETEPNVVMFGWAVLKMTFRCANAKIRNAVCICKCSYIRPAECTDSNHPSTSSSSISCKISSKLGRSVTSEDIHLEPSACNTLILHAAEVVHLTPDHHKLASLTQLAQKHTQEIIQCCQTWHANLKLRR